MQKLIIKNKTMKTKNAIKLLMILFIGIAFTACSDDDDATPDPVNEEEVITTLTLTLVPDGGGTPVTLVSRDLDGDGPNAPVKTVSGPLTAGTTYSGTVVVLNETETPAENVTQEVIAEAEEHQFFYIPGAALDVTFTYDDTDANGDPLGVLFTVVANSASGGNLNVVLRHEPTKPNNGTLAGAGGETDISVNFDVTVN